jgi:hypothetical protein
MPDATFLPVGALVRATRSSYLRAAMPPCQPPSRFDQLKNEILDYHEEIEDLVTSPATDWVRLHVVADALAQVTARVEMLARQQTSGLSPG